MSTTETKCYLCGVEQPFTNLHAVAGPVFGPVIDLSISADWFCAGCFQRYRDGGNLRRRVIDSQDRFCHQARELVRSLEAVNLEVMTGLPAGLRLEAGDRDRVEQIQEEIHDVRRMQDPETLRACFKLYRNHQRAPFFIGAELVDYEDLKGRFARL